jgi:hemerythrin
VEKIEWNEWLSLKIPSIDEEHRKLFDYIRQLNEAVTNDRGEEVLKSVLDGMARYADYHFKHEEELFETHKYPGEAAHAEAHKNYVTRVNDFMKSHEAGNSINPKLVLIFLNNWWINHITTEDKAYSAFMVEKGVQ